MNKIYKLSITTAIVYSIVAVLVMQIIAGIITIPSFFIKELFSITLPLGFLFGMLAAIFTLLAILHCNIKPILTDLKKKINIIFLILSIIIWFGFLPLTEYVTSLIPTDGPLEDLFKTFEDNFSLMLDNKIAGFITVCILAPILEEILFRGIVFKGMINNNVNPFLAIIVSGIIFGIAHMNPWQFIGAGILGSIFAYIYYKTENLLIPIILHAINNSISFVVLLQSKDMNEEMFDSSNYLILIIPISVSIICMLLLNKLTKKQQWN